MEENKKAFMAWVKANKKKLFIAGISIAAIIGIIIGIKHHEELLELWSQLEKRIKKVSKTNSIDVIPEGNYISTSDIVVTHRYYTPPQESFEVKQHIRKMAEGKHHSARKAVEAAELGIVLPPNYTLVDSYTKGVA